MRKYASNTDEVLRRGAVVCSNSGFVVVACVLCGHQYLYDEEILRVYVDPEDLSIGYLGVAGESPACAGCSSSVWQFGELDLDSPQVIRGPWAWVR